MNNNQLLGRSKPGKRLSRHEIASLTRWRILPLRHSRGPRRHPRRVVASSGQSAGRS